MESQLENAEKKIKNADKKLESAGVEPGDMEKTLYTYKTSESEEKKAACAEKKAESRGEVTISVGEVSAHAGEVATEKIYAKDVGKKRDGKNKISRKKIAGGVELAAAFILAVMSGWLFSNTRGTRLLYVSVTTGRVSRYYWIFLAAALIFLAIGVFTLRFRPREEKEN